MKTALLALLMVAAAAPAPRRSEGYAGSTPVGLDGYRAFSPLDCAKINGDKRRSRVRVPLSADCALSVPAPNGHLIVNSAPDAGGDYIELRATGGLKLIKIEQPVTLLWNPRSMGFLLNDGEGSGQVSRLRYFAYRDGHWSESRILDRAATRLYLRRYDCRGGADSYTNVSGWDWTAKGHLRAIVQEGVHSKGCLQPYEDRNVMLEVIGDPGNGRIISAREVRTLS